MNELIN